MQLFIDAPIAVLDFCLIAWASTSTHKSTLMPKYRCQFNVVFTSQLSGQMLEEQHFELAVLSHTP